MIVKGVFHVHEPNFANPAVNVGEYYFYVYAANIVRMSAACAALHLPVAGATSADMGRACAVTVSGQPYVAEGFPIVVCQANYNAPLHTTEYFARVTSGFTQCSNLDSSYGQLTAGGFSPADAPTDYVAAIKGVVNVNALKGAPGFGRGYNPGLFMDYIPKNIATKTVLFVACDNLGGASSGGSLYINGTDAVFVYTKPLTIKPILTAELVYSGEAYVAVTITDISLTQMTMTFKDEYGNVVNFPGGRLGISGIMFTG